MSKTMQGAFYEFLFLNLPAAHCCRHCQLLAHPSGQQNPFHITEVEKVGSRDFLGVQWLRICFAMPGTWVRFMVGELRSYMLRSN